MDEYGVDLAIWWHQRRWVALLDLIEQLPTACRWREAMHKDPEYARQVLAYEDKHGDQQSKKLWTPPWSEFDTTAIELREIVNLLHGIGTGLGLFSGGKPFPEPETALAVLKQRRADHETDLMIAQLLGR